MKEIHLGHGVTTQVDEEDYARFGHLRWCFNRNRDGSPRYAVRKEAGKVVYLHAAIMCPPPGFVVDHADLNKLNNRRSNLRLGTRSQNNANTGKRGKRPSSRFKGVSWHGQRQKWVAGIKHSSARIYLGLFTDESEAARAYDAKAGELYGEFARLNFPHEVQN